MASIIQLGLSQGLAIKRAGICSTAENYQSSCPARSLSEAEFSCMLEDAWRITRRLFSSSTWPPSPSPAPVPVRSVLHHGQDHTYLSGPLFPQHPSSPEQGLR